MQQLQLVKACKMQYCKENDYGPKLSMFKLMVN